MPALGALLAATSLLILGYATFPGPGDAATPGEALVPPDPVSWTLQSDAFSTYRRGDVQFKTISIAYTPGDREERLLFIDDALVDFRVTTAQDLAEVLQFPRYQCDCDDEAGEAWVWQRTVDLAPAQKEHGYVILAKGTFEALEIYVRYEVLGGGLAPPLGLGGGTASMVQEYEVKYYDECFANDDVLPPASPPSSPPSPPGSPDSDYDTYEESYTYEEQAASVDFPGDPRYWHTLGYIQRARLDSRTIYSFLLDRNRTLVGSENATVDNPDVEIYRWNYVAFNASMDLPEQFTIEMPTYIPDNRALEAADATNATNATNFTNMSQLYDLYDTTLTSPDCVRLDWRDVIKAQFSFLKANGDLDNNGKRMEGTISRWDPDVPGFQGANFTAVGVIVEAGDAGRRRRLKEARRKLSPASPHGQKLRLAPRRLFGSSSAVVALESEEIGGDRRRSEEIASSRTLTAAGRSLQSLASDVGRQLLKELDAERRKRDGFRSESVENAIRQLLVPFIKVALDKSGKLVEWTMSNGQRKSQRLADFLGDTDPIEEGGDGFLEEGTVDSVLADTQVNEFLHKLGAVLVLNNFVSQGLTDLKAEEEETLKAYLEGSEDAQPGMASEAGFQEFRAMLFSDVYVAKHGVLRSFLSDVNPRCQKTVRKMVKPAKCKPERLAKMLYNAAVADHQQHFARFESMSPTLVSSGFQTRQAAVVEPLAILDMTDVVPTGRVTPSGEEIKITYSESLQDSMLALQFRYMTQFAQPPNNVTEVAAMLTMMDQVRYAAACSNDTALRENIGITDEDAAGLCAQFLIWERAWLNLTNATWDSSASADGGSSNEEYSLSDRGDMAGRVAAFFGNPYWGMTNKILFQTYNYLAEFVLMASWRGTLFRRFGSIALQIEVKEGSVTPPEGIKKITRYEWGERASRGMLTVGCFAAISGILQLGLQDGGFSAATPEDKWRIGLQSAGAVTSLAWSFLNPVTSKGGRFDASNSIFKAFVEMRGGKESVDTVEEAIASVGRSSSGDWTQWSSSGIPRGSLYGDAAALRPTIKATDAREFIVEGAAGGEAATGRSKSVAVAESASSQTNRAMLSFHEVGNLERDGRKSRPTRTPALDQFSSVCALSGGGTLRRLDSTGGATPGARPTLGRFTGRQLADGNRGTQCTGSAADKVAQSSKAGRAKRYGVGFGVALTLVVLSAVQIGLAALQTYMAWLDWHRHIDACKGSEKDYCSDESINLMALEFKLEMAALAGLVGIVVLDILRFFFVAEITANPGSTNFMTQQGQNIFFNQFKWIAKRGAFQIGVSVFKYVFAAVGLVTLGISIYNEITRSKRDQDFGELVRPDLKKQSKLFGD